MQHEMTDQQLSERVCRALGSELRELLKRDGTLMYFQSGSVCHRDCEPSESYKQMIQKFRGRDAC